MNLQCRIEVGLVEPTQWVGQGTALMTFASMNKSDVTTNH